MLSFQMLSFFVELLVRMVIVVILEQHKRKLEVCVSVSSYHVPFIVCSMDRPS